MQPNGDISVIRSQTEPLCDGVGSSILLLEVTLKHGTLVCVFVGCYRMFSTPLNRVVVTKRHVTKTCLALKGFAQASLLLKVVV